MTGEGLPATLREQLEGFVARVQRETRVPGIGVAVSAGGERLTVCAGVRAVERPEPLEPSARYHLGCTNKLLLAALALELEQASVLDLAATLGVYLPELRATAHGRAVRVEHLLSHTSGYRGTHLLDPTTRIDSWSELVRYLSGAPALFAPGTVFSYEHTESVVLAEVLRRATGVASAELIANRLLAPLGIAPGAFGSSAGEQDAGRHRFDERSGQFVALERVVPRSRFWLPAFSAYTVTLEDLLCITEAVIGVPASAGPDSVVLGKPTLRALTTSVVRLPRAASGSLSELLPVAFGLGTAEHRDGSRGNTGISAGQCLGLRYDPRSRVCVAVALNAAAPHLRDFILAAIYRELVPAPAEGAVAPFEFELATLEGTYLGPAAGIVTARRDGERLVAEIGREHLTQRLRVELTLDSVRRLVLRSPLPHLSMGFFREPLGGALGLMIGLSAYRKVAS